jgi:hypothetical protein
MVMEMRVLESRINVLRDWVWNKDSISVNEDNVLVVRDCWIGFQDNPWLPKDTFYVGTDPYIYVYVFKNFIRIDDYPNHSKYFPIMEQFGAVKATVYGLPCIKISLVNNPKVKFIK